MTFPRTHLRLLCGFAAVSLMLTHAELIAASPEDAANPPGENREPADAEESAPDNEAEAPGVDSGEDSTQQLEAPVPEGDSEAQAPPPDFSKPGSAQSFYCPIHGFHAQADVGQDRLLDLILPPTEPIPN